MSRLLDALKGQFPEIANVSPGAYVVGGAVRDLLVNLTPFDVDVAMHGARAEAERVAAVTLGRFVDLGRDRFATFRVVIGEREFDFSELEGDLHSDLARRDCTVDAIALELPGGEVIDPHDGAGDCRRRLVRMLREKNFTDDPLRVLKLIRLAVRLDFEIEPETLTAMSRQASGLAQVAVERITYELFNILDDSRAANGLALLRQTGADELCFNRPLHDRDLARAATLLEADAIVKIAAIFFEDGIGAIESSARRLRWPEAELRRASAMIRLASQLGELREKSERLIALYDAGAQISADVVLLLGAVGRQQLSIEIAQLLVHRANLFAITPLLNGEEITALTGRPAGRELGALKRSMLEAQIRGEISTREEAERFVRR